MLRIRVRENGQLRLNRRLPEEYREIGCVFLLQETFVATLSHGGSVECGTFQVSLVDDDSSDPTDVIDDKERIARHERAHFDTVDLSTRDRGPDDETEQPGSAAPTILSDQSVAPTPVTLEVHPRISGYDFQALVGRGGMGLVWKAVQLSTNRMVAVKTIHPRMLGNSKNQKRFQREVELAAKLTHPNIVRVYEAGEILGQNYFSMELVDGVPWSQYVRSHRPGKKVVLKQLLQVLDAVSYAHAQGVVHRDLKPSNILIDTTGKVYVVDFGLAKHQAVEEEQLSQEGDIIGTLTFMSPEQASGDVSLTDSRSDVYSLGAVIVYLLCNGLSVDKIGGNDSRRVRDDGALQKTAAGVLSSDPRLKRILLKALAPEPEQRYQDAGAFASDLREYLEDRLTEVFQGKAKRRRRKSYKKWLVVVPLLLIGAAAGLVYWQHRSAPPSAEASQEAEVVVPEPDADETKKTLRDKAIEEKFGDQIHATFLSTGQDPGVGKATIGVGTEDDADYFIVHPEGWPLVGFNLTTYEFKEDLIIKTMQPIFRDPNTGEIARSQMVGKINQNSELYEVIAKPGYGVSGLEAGGGDRLYALRVIFRADGSDPSISDGKERYESPWYGEVGYRQSQIVGDTEALAIGFICSFKVDMHQVGLILEETPRDP